MLGALLEVLQERYPPSLARAVIDWIRTGEATGLDLAHADRLTARAVEIAEAAEWLLAGVTFSEHFAISAVADGPRFRRALHAAGLAVDALDFGSRLQADAAFAALWRGCTTQGEAAAHALMVEVLSAILGAASR